MAEEATGQGGLKDRDLQKYYESMLALFEQPGWAYLMEDLKKVFDAADSLQGVEDLRQLDFRRGQLDILKLIVMQPATIGAAYEELLGQDNESEDDL